MLKLFNENYEWDEQIFGEKELNTKNPRLLIKKLEMDLNSDEYFESMVDQSYSSDSSDYNDYPNGEENYDLINK